MWSRWGHLALGGLLPGRDGIGQLPVVVVVVVLQAHAVSRNSPPCGDHWSPTTVPPGMVRFDHTPDQSGRHHLHRHSHHDDPSVTFKFSPQQQNTNRQPYFLLCLIISVPGNQNEIFLNLIEPLTWLPRFIHRAHFLFCFGITNAMSPFKESDVG